jgi:hypothetical protein
MLSEEFPFLKCHEEEITDAAHPLISATTCAVCQEIECDYLMNLEGLLMGKSKCDLSVYVPMLTYSMFTLQLSYLVLWLT